MKNSLKTLGRVKKFEIDEQRKILATYLDKEDNILKFIQRLSAEFEKEKKFSEENPMLGQFGHYLKRYLETKNILDAQLREVRIKIVEIRDIIVDMFKEQKTYDIVDKRREEALIKEIDLKNQSMLDEIGTNSYIRKHNIQNEENNNDF